MLSYLPVAKVAVQFVAGLGVSKILSGIVQNNVTVVTTAEKLVVNAGSLVLGSMLVEQSSNHIERVTSDVSTWLENRKLDTDKEAAK